MDLWYVGLIALWHVGSYFLNQVESMSPALEGGVLTTGLPGKSPASMAGMAWSSYRKVNLKKWLTVLDIPGMWGLCPSDWPITHGNKLSKSFLLGGDELFYGISE